jgi:uncharacterized surface protein with fasciclin (FAS1) repeats
MMALFFAVTLATAQNPGQTVLAIARADGQFNALIRYAQVAGLTQMYEANGPFTVFAPTDAAFGALPPDVISRLGNDANFARQVLLYHTLQGNYTAAEAAALGTTSTGLGRNVTIENRNGTIFLNGQARVVHADRNASNGKLHAIDAVLSPEGGVLGAATGSNTPGTAPPQSGGARLDNPNDNPAYAGAGNMSYHVGVQSPSDSCKGMTWTLLLQRDGVAKVGSDRQTNPYRGDTDCGNSRPILCIRVDYSPPPSAEYSYGWAFGQVRLSSFVTGSQLTSLDVANGICARDFGQGWVMAEFHDGGMGRYPGRASGWEFWAHGGLPLGQRFWVHINDQPANPWNSVQQRWGPNYQTDRTILRAGENPAYVPGPIMKEAQARAAGRAWCKGTTWVLLYQANGLTLVGADASTNAFVGDRSCPESLPLLCIKVDGLPPPPSGGGNLNYSHSWSGGHIALTSPVTGDQINTRAKANAVCRNTFGSGWRMASHHDGALGTGGTEGWDFWAYGNLQIGRRFWVAVNDQYANPWNPHGTEYRPR